MSLYPKNTKILKIEKYNPTQWSVTPGKIAPDVYKQGKLAGQKNPNAGELQWLTTQQKYPGNSFTTAKHVLDVILEHEMFIIENEQDLRDMLKTINENVENFTQTIADMLTTSDSFVLKL